MRGYVGPDDGYMAKVLRLLSAAALLVVVAAGCGGAAQPQKSAFRGVPRALAQDWEGQARAIAAAGNGCQALQLANSLRTEVLAKEHKLPLRLRSPLVVGVNNLKDRITCTPVVQTPLTTPKPPKGPKPKPPHKPDDKGHHKGHDK
jgi:hypothetical protein